MTEQEQIKQINLLCDGNKNLLNLTIKIWSLCRKLDVLPDLIDGGKRVLRPITFDWYSTTPSTNPFIEIFNDCSILCHPGGCTGINPNPELILNKVLDRNQKP